ncbi:TPA: hypothetical protein ACOQ0H_003864 [Bacillus cereus]
MNSLSFLAEDFLKKYGNYQLQELMFYTKYKNTPEKLIHLIAWSITSNGKTHPHQYRIKRTVKEHVEKYLLNNYDKIQQIKDFDTLMKLFRGITGVGPLTSYDMATRLGFCFGITPKKIYLHRGTYIGAKNLLGNKVTGRSFLKLKDLPKELHHLTPLQIEDFLCIYKEAFLNINKLPKPCSKEITIKPKVC